MATRKYDNASTTTCAHDDSTLISRGLVARGAAHISARFRDVVSAGERVYELIAMALDRRATRFRSAVETPSRGIRLAVDHDRRVL
jgi:hypothetical protein